MSLPEFYHLLVLSQVAAKAPQIVHALVACSEAIAIKRFEERDKQASADTLDPEPARLHRPTMSTGR